MKRVVVLAVSALLLLSGAARAEVDVVKIPKGAGGVGFLPLIVMEEKKLVEAEAQKIGLKLSADEWLTVAARDAQGPLTPGAVDDASTIVIRIRGGDLAAFHAGKLTRDDVLKKVEVREF